MAKPLVPGALLVASFAAAAQPVLVGVVLHFEQKPDPRFVGQLRQEVDRIFRPAGIELRWERRDEGQASGAYAMVVSFTLKGQCGAQRAEAPVEPPEGTVKLGWSLVAGGEVLPYSGVDCDQIARVAQSGGFQFPRNFRHVVYQRLAGRVVAHELVHVLLRTREHHATPLGRSPLNPASLGFDAALEPAEIAALRQLAKPGPERLIAGRGLFFGKPN